MTLMVSFNPSVLRSNLSLGVSCALLIGCRRTIGAPSGRFAAGAVAFLRDVPGLFADAGDRAISNLFSNVGTGAPRRERRAESVKVDLSPLGLVVDQAARADAHKSHANQDNHGVIDQRHKVVEGLRSRE